MRKFTIPDNPNIPTGYWNDPNNSVPYYNTARTVIENNQVRIQLDYEVADLGREDPNNWIGSPLACWDIERNKSGYVRSDRYVYLQTYTITNIQDPNLPDPNIVNLEFYQMLHSHGADDYGQSVGSVYQTYRYDDPLEDYTPYNPIHQAGNFRFDISQWNDPDHPDSDCRSTPHKDWVGFSCTLEPNTIENGIYRGHDGEPTIGTHKNIEKRDLNEETENFYDEVAGAYHSRALEYPNQDAAYLLGETTTWMTP